MSRPLPFTLISTPVFSLNRLFDRVFATYSSGSLRVIRHCFFILFILGVSASTAYSQTTKSAQSFEQYVASLNGPIVSALENRDMKAYIKHKQEFQSRYNKLPAAEKEKFKEVGINLTYYQASLYGLLGNEELAISYLQQAIDAGFSDYSILQHDPGFEQIRHLEVFSTLVRPLREVGDYLYILKKSAAYNPEESRELPVFTYQSSDSPELKALKSAFNLDSIAGAGNEVSRIINLMHWVHNLIPHDGNMENPVVKNAMSLIGECKSKGRGLNCRGLATILNESYLAMGFKSRIVTCLPKDSLKIDMDTHVINMVFAESLGKWVWMDPTNAAYVMNEKGELLSIEEVRERLIADKPLILNPDANWNRTFSRTKEEYLYQYMAKNLYMLESPARSEYNLETRENGKSISYIRLLPFNDYEQKPDRTESINETTNFSIVTYKTNKSEAFWQIP